MPETKEADMDEEYSDFKLKTYGRPLREVIGICSSIASDARVSVHEDWLAFDFRDAANVAMGNVTWDMDESYDCIQTCELDGDEFTAGIATGAIQKRLKYARKSKPTAMGDEVGIRFVDGQVSEMQRGRTELVIAREPKRKTGVANPDPDSVPVHEEFSPDQPLSVEIDVDGLSAAMDAMTHNYFQARVTDDDRLMFGRMRADEMVEPEDEFDTFVFENASVEYDGDGEYPTSGFSQSYVQDMAEALSSLDCDTVEFMLGNEYPGTLRFASWGTGITGHLSLAPRITSGGDVRG